MKPLDVTDAMSEIRTRWRFKFDLDQSLVALLRVGSHSHGTYVPPVDPNGIDDTDYMMILAPPPSSVYGLERFDNWGFNENGVDVVVYSWDKYIRLLLKSNPNVIGTLWLRDEDVYNPLSYTTQVNPWNYVRVRRNIFSCKAVYDSFVGYAKGQMYKMTHHAHQGYMGDKRKRLVEQYGYDVKNAAHMIRLLRMACEFLETGKFVVHRPDADELIEIKQGKWTMDQVLLHSDALLARAEESYALSTLPAHPDQYQAEKLLLLGYDLMWKGMR